MITPKVEIEPIYDIMMNDDGQIVLVMSAREEAPEEPIILISDSADKGILKRNPELNVSLTEMHPEAAESLRKAEMVAIIEVAEEEIKHAYEASVTISNAA